MEVAVPAGRGELLQLRAQLRVDGDLLVVGGRGQVEVVEVQQPGQLAARVLVVVGAQVDRDVVEAAVPGAVTDHQHRRRLPPAPVAAGVVAGLQRVDQPPRERLVRVGQPVLLDRLDHLGPDQDVALDRVPVAGPAAGPVQALVAGVLRGPAVGVDHPDLPVVAALVLLDQRLHHLGGGGAGVEVGERQALVGHVGVGLGGDRADPRDGRGHRGSHREELGGDGDTPGLTVVGPGHDRERHAPETSHPRTPGSDIRLPCPRGRRPTMGACCTDWGSRAWASTAASSPRSPWTPSAAGCSCRSRCSTSWSPPRSAWCRSAPRSRSPRPCPSRPDRSSAASSTGSAPSGCSRSRT